MSDIQYVQSGRRFGKSYHAMQFTPPSELLVGNDEPVADTSGYARHRPADCSAIQVALFDEYGREPIRDPSYRRMLVRFARDGDAMVNTETITFPAATCRWGVIDEARFFGEMGEELFSLDVRIPPSLPAGSVVFFEPGGLRWVNPELGTAMLGARPEGLTKEKAREWSRLIAENGLPGSPADEARKAVASKPQPREYTFPAVTGIEHGQTTSVDYSTFALNPTVDTEFVFRSFPVQTEPCRSFTLTGIIPPEIPTDPPPPPPAPAEPEKGPAPEEDLAAIRAHNIRIMLSGA